MAITYGMSVKEFWENDPDLFWAYRFSYFEKIKLQQEIFNNNAWLQGAYFHEAVSVALCNAFGSQKIKYSEKPYNFNENTGQSKEQHTNALVERLKGRISQVQKILNDGKEQQIIVGENRV